MTDLEKGMVLDCPECKKTFVRAVRKVVYGEVFRAYHVERIDGPEIEDGDKVQCHFCGYTPWNDYFCTPANWKVLGD